MEENMIDSPATEYFSTRSRASSIESSASDVGVDSAPLSKQGKRSIGVSVNARRQYKDKRIYLNNRTGLPVRPPTSFGLFKHAMRRNIKAGKVGFQEFNRASIEKWMKMKAEEKEPYVQRAKKLAEEFKKVETPFLRKKVRQLLAQVKEYRREVKELERRRR